MKIIIVVVDTAKTIEVPIALECQSGFFEVMRGATVDADELQSSIAIILNNPALLKTAQKDDTRFVIGFCYALVQLIMDELEDELDTVIVCLDGEISSRQFETKNAFDLHLKTMAVQLGLEFPPSHTIPRASIH